jgi:hypothetical protein
MNEDVDKESNVIKDFNLDASIGQWSHHMLIKYYSSPILLELF